MSEIGYEATLHANLERVFGERNPARRLAAIRELYADDAVLHEAERSVPGA